MLTALLIRVAVVVAILAVVGLFLIIGRYRLRRTLTEWPRRLQAAAPVTVILVVILLLNRHYRQQAPELERQIGIHGTEAISQLEGQLILVFQDVATGELNAFFSFIYVYGYAFLLIFPVLAYFSLSNTRPLRELLTAYTLNYAIGLACYTVFIVYGPRNYFPELVEATMLYDSYPAYQHLTREVNRNTNVFPSLHTSLAATVATFAYLTREIYPKWFPIAVFLAASVAVSTMYLAIHWFIDVLAGLVLAGVSVLLARYLVGRFSLSVAVADRFRRLLDR